MLGSGESLRFSGQSNVATAQVTNTPSPAAARAEDQAPSSSLRGARENTPPGPSGPVSAAITTDSDWAALVSKGHFGDVVQAAKALGTDRVLGERSAKDLNALAHSAHYTGQSPLAISAWRALRQRFAQANFGRQAAFFLGRVHDQEGRSAEALRWLNVYLTEAPRDVYASEALGRKVTLVQKLEGQAAARKVAREYLQRFPNGTYARAARAIVAGP
jgi:TolA-binding protein